MTIYVRYIAGETMDEAQANAAADLERGYSIAQYQVFESREAAEQSDMALYGGYDVESIVELPAGGFAFALPGLCGYEVADSLEDVDLSEARVYEGYSFYALFEGRYKGQTDAADGDVFKPSALLSVAAL